MKSLLLTLMIVMPVMLCVTGCNEASSTVATSVEPQTKIMPVGFVITDDGVVLMCNSETAIHGVTLYIGNPMNWAMGGNAYKFECSNILKPSGEYDRYIKIPFSRFTKSNGERFNPYRFAVVELWIGGGNDTGRRRCYVVGILEAYY